ncbi:uncharacterized protein LOC100215604 isoform X2 [Hydra vulgaris]|uniref:Uncharacterized protein LOC100215604 isoform X2 n=1 Tax=Hydra vulgaris TaxID=6087 RepID=A0ABM4BSR7_HYDVU
MEALFVFFDLEASHADKYFGDIIEIGAQVDPRLLKKKVFQSLIKTDQKLCYFALNKCSIKESDLVNQRSFPEVFTEFLDWVKSMIKEATSIHKKHFYPVLVAHGGFENDFMMIQGNMHRFGMNIKLLSDMCFADTYYFAKKLRENGLKILQGCQLSIKELLKKIFPYQKFHGLHRALADVKFMIKIFLESPLKVQFNEIEIATFNKTQLDFTSRVNSKENCRTLEATMPVGLAKVTYTMTLKRLLRNGLTHERLIEVFQNSVSFQDFYDQMKIIGIERKASKSLAARLSSMGYVCNGEDKSTLDANSSGYKLVVNSGRKNTADFFYNMFSDEFFFAPDEYEFEFGDFAKDEIQSIDDYFENLFYSKYRIKLRVKKRNITKENRDNKYAHINESVKQQSLQKSNEDCENWETDILPFDVEFELPTNRGRLAKVSSIGMTEDCLNGRSYSARVPLFKHFEDIDLKARPSGGIPKPVNKESRKKRNVKTKNKILDELHASNRNAVRANDGEVYILP